MESYRYLLDLAIILLSTKLLGLVFQKFKLPQVIGALLAGIIIGPACFGIVEKTELITALSEIGVIMLMFLAGVETDIQEFKKAGKASLVIALCGVFIPLAGGFACLYFFNKPGLLGSADSTRVMLENVFMGVILTATSVSITVQTLKELGKLNSAAGTAIMGAAIIDDILGIIILTIVTSMADPEVNIVTVLLKIVLFFVFVAVVGGAYYFVFKKWTAGSENKRRFVVISIAFALFMSFAAEEFFGVADITGAFFAGLIISSLEKSHYVEKRCDTISYGFLSPIFFTSIGLAMTLPKMSGTLILFTVAIIVVAVLTKYFGCMFGAKLFKYSSLECKQIGIGMVSRGEVALIVAQKGAAVGLVSASLMGPIILMVVVTTVIAPVLLNIVFKEKKEAVTA
ncbi:MAG: cation:proton antiporter [bacterium]|nr:cation:proton antiporter [bacterium]